jgi:diaminopimelate epimerase
MEGEPSSTFLEQPLDVNGRKFKATALSMGNPHCVLFLDPSEDLDGLDVPTLGPLVERKQDFPRRTNVEFVKGGGD